MGTTEGGGSGRHVRHAMSTHRVRSREKCTHTRRRRHSSATGGAHPRICTRVRAHAPPSSVSNAGFVGEMRRVAMRLHSPEQLRKKKEADKKREKEEQQEERRFAPTLKGYTRFLRQS